MRFEELEVWRKARELTNTIYAVTKEGSFSRDFCFRDQIRRASLSIMSNIAEGYERDGNKEFVQYLYIAKGSCGEVRSQLHLALDQDYIDAGSGRSLVEEFMKLSIMIRNFISYLKSSNYRGEKYRNDGDDKALGDEAR